MLTLIDMVDKNPTLGARSGMGTSGNFIYSLGTAFLQLL